MPQSTGAWSGIRAGELLRYLAGLYATPQHLGLLVADLRLEPLLRELRTAGVGVVLTTHAMEEAEALADQVFILDAGRVAVSGTVAELTGNGQSLEDVFLSHTSLPAS